MPTSYAHYKFGQKVVEKLPEKYQYFAYEYPEYFYPALHGPDLGFYLLTKPALPTLSDELLAMDGIDEKITAFAKDYSTINPSTVGDSWAHVREDGAFGYLVANTRPRTFIVFEMSDEQPDKIRGMKVTIVDVNDPLPEQGIEPGGTGLFYPKFPHGK